MTTKISERYFEKPKWLKTQSGIPVKETYTPDDVKAIDYERDIADPGQFPYTRGIFPDMYRGRMWSMREICGYDSPRETNKRLRYLIEQGESALNVITDMPGMCAIDSDHPRAEGAVGVEGVPISSLRDMEVMTEGIPLDQVSFTLSTHALAHYSYFAIAEKQGIPLDKIRGTTFNAALTVPFLRYHPVPFDIDMRASVDSIVWQIKNVPRFYPLCMGAEGLRESGATAAQEIAIDFCLCRHIMKEAVKRGADINELGRKTSFTHRVGVDIFEEAAKFRAARRIWARMLKEEFGATHPLALAYKVHVVTKGSDLVAQQPENNIIRIAYQALAAVLGGVQSMHTTSFDEPICLPTEESSRIAVRTQQILAYETGVVNVADPLGGSYYVESLTNELEGQILRIMEEFRETIAPAVESGQVYQRLCEQAYEFQREVENGERTLVGVNAFTIPEEEEREARVHVTNEEAVREHLENLKELRRTRDTKKVKEALENLRRAAADPEDILCDEYLEAVKAYATLGEINGAIRLGYGYDYDPFGELQYPF